MVNWNSREQNTDTDFQVGEEFEISVKVVAVSGNPNDNKPDFLVLKPIDLPDNVQAGPFVVKLKPD